MESLDRDQTFTKDRYDVPILLCGVRRVKYVLITAISHVDLTHIDVDLNELLHIDGERPWHSENLKVLS